jgi:hypothetical protein
VAISFIGKGNRSTRRKPLTCHKSLTNFITGDSIAYFGRGRRGRDCMIVGFTTTFTIDAYHHWCCEFESRSWRGAQHYVIKFVRDLWQCTWPVTFSAWLRYFNKKQHVKLVLWAQTFILMKWYHYASIFTYEQNANAHRQLSEQRYRTESSFNIYSDKTATVIFYRNAKQ